MGWVDVVAGVCTGGLYTVGKAIYQAGNAAEDAGMQRTNLHQLLKMYKISSKDFA